MTSSLRNLKVYATHPHRCSYLPERKATTLFVDPLTPIDQALYTRLSTIGFRRSGPHIYRPHCATCQACVPARVPVVDFQMSRAQRRVLRRNEDLVVRRRSAIEEPQGFALYTRYIEQRHADGDMFPPDEAQYRAFLGDALQLTEYIHFYHGEVLLAVAVLDVLLDGLSAIYTFYAPEEARRGLGSYAVLWQIAEARRRQLPYVYLGYWIQDCRKMAYKSDYQPLEMYWDNQWHLKQHD